MYTLFHLLPLRRVIFEQIPQLALAGIIELFYKFHSFTLECAAFLATWFVLDVLVQRLARRIIKPLIQAAR